MTASEGALSHRWGPLAWFFTVREWLSRLPLSILQLGMRFGVGLVFFNAGLLKYRSFEFAIKLFEDEYRCRFSLLL